MLLAMLLQASVPAEPPAADAPPAPFATVAMGGRDKRTIEFRHRADSPIQDDYILHRITLRPDRSLDVRITSSRECAAVGQSVARLSALPAPTVQLPFERGSIVMDGRSYSIDFIGRFGTGSGVPMRFVSGDDTPLAEWVRATFDLLEPCWADGPDGARPAQPG